MLLGVVLALLIEGVEGRDGRAKENEASNASSVAGFRHVESTNPCVITSGCKRKGSELMVGLFGILLQWSNVESSTDGTTSKGARVCACRTEVVFIE